MICNACAGRRAGGLEGGRAGGQGVRVKCARLTVDACTKACVLCMHLHILMQEHDSEKKLRNGLAKELESLFKLRVASLESTVRLLRADARGGSSGGQSANLIYQEGLGGIVDLCQKYCDTQRDQQEETGLRVLKDFRRSQDSRKRKADE